MQGSGTDGRAYGVARWGTAAPRAVIGSQPALERVELALTFRSGYLQDPSGLDGLAHLCEHVTLAADPANLGGFIDERVGALNAFTAEETTTFHLEFDVDDERDARDEVSEVCQRFAALFDQSRPTSAALVRQELPRIYAEWEALVRAPPRTAIELAALKQRADASTGWRRLGRGNARTIALADASSLAFAVDELRASRYNLGEATLALTSSLSLGEAADVLRAAFAPSSAALPRAPASLVREARSLSALPFVGREEARAVEIASRGRGAILSLAWSVPFDDAVATARRKPLAVLGMALTSPHAGSLSARLREVGLSPPLSMQEPVVLTRKLSQTSAWSVWQLEIVLLDGAEARWQEAYDLAVKAVDGLASRTVPTHVAVESGTLAALAWRYSARAPTALELSVDLQAEPVAALAVSSRRGFAAPAAANAAAATAAARHCAATPPVVTLYVPSLKAAGLSTSTTGTAPPSAGPAELQLRTVPLVLRHQRPKSLLARIALPPINLWVPRDASPIQQPLMPPLRVGACALSRAGGELPGCLRASTADGMGVLQLPGCIDELGSQSALAAVSCMATPGLPPRPFGATLLQLYTRRPQLAYNGEQRATPASARAELWRYALAEAVGTDGALAARAGAKWEVTFNPAGLRIAIVAPSEKLQRLLSLVLRLARRRHVARGTDGAAPREAALSLAEVEAGRAAALRALRPQLDSPSAGGAELLRTREAALRATTADELEGEITALWDSMLAADLVVAGAVTQDVATRLVDNVRSQLRPTLQVQPEDGLQQYALQGDDLAAGLDAFQALLYRPAYEPRPLAQNLCLEPALAATLDQCGSL